jgi:hypothetical protein
MGEAEDALRRLERRLDSASAAAERLIDEAAAAASGRADRTPPSGWQVPGSSEDHPEGDVLVQLVQAARELIPPELQRRLAEALRELLLALRALIDWYLERAERRRTQPAEVQDIPIL